MSGNLLAYYETNKNHPRVLKGGVFLREDHVSQTRITMMKKSQNLELEVIKLDEVKVEQNTLGTFCLSLFTSRVMLRDSEF